MKQPISWHKSCLANMKANAERHAQQVLIAQKFQMELLEEITEFEAQIAQAEARGLDGFDSERFMKKKGS